MATIDMMQAVPGRSVVEKGPSMVDRQLSILASEIAEARGVFDVLYDKLRSALIPTDPSPEAANAPRQSTSPLADAIADRAEAIRRLKVGMMDVVERLTL